MNRSIVSDRSRTDKFFGSFVKRIPSYISPDFITLVSVVPALVFVFLLWISKEQTFPLNALIFFLAFWSLLFASFLDGLDGALARKRKEEGKRTEEQSKFGDILDHSLDRYCDLIIFFGIYIGEYCSFKLFSFTSIAVLLVSYFGALTKSVYGSRDYGGIMGRLIRLLVIAIAVIISLLVVIIFRMDSLKDFNLGGSTILGWAMIIILGGSLITVLQRHYNAYKISKALQ